MTGAAAWLVVPVVLPLLAGALLLALERLAPRLVGGAAVLATALLFAVALQLFVHAASGEVSVYLVGNWRAPFGIVLALDRLSALMLLLMAGLALPCLLYALPGEAQHGPHFHAFFQFQLAGLAGAFLTGDLFNLFVFFELLLIASYALLLHGAGARALSAGFRYVTVNLVGSALFLIAASLLYGLAGTLNLADLAVKLPALPPGSVGLARAAGLLLLVVFAIKAAVAPLGFWLPSTYAAAPAAVAALFALMTKVGIYAVLRVGTLLFGPEAGPLAGLGSAPLFALGLVTVVVAAAGASSAHRLQVLAAFLVAMSAGTLVAALSLAPGLVQVGALYYLVHSVVAGALLFLVADAVARQRGAQGGTLRSGPPPAQRTLLGLLFLGTAAAVAGLPPLSGFIGKVGILAGAVGVVGQGWLWGVLLVAGLAATVALARAGSQVFWKTTPDPVGAGHAPARMAAAEVVAIGALAACGVALVVFAAPLQAYATATVNQLAQPQAYIDAVLARTPVPPPMRARHADATRPFTHAAVAPVGPTP